MLVYTDGVSFLPNVIRKKNFLFQQIISNGHDSKQTVYDKSKQ